MSTVRTERSGRATHTGRTPTRRRADTIPATRYGECVFVNCPFDEDYRPLLEAILFCIIDCDLTPRIAMERLDSGEARLDKIVELIRSSRFSIHDLSRVRAAKLGELARLNMPFELGLAYGMSVTEDSEANARHILIIAEHRHRYQEALSDIAGWDIRSHGGSYEGAIRHVRAWLQSHGVASRSRSQIVGDYTGFQEWDYERLLSDGWNETDIQERETTELLESMYQWRESGRPATFT